MSCHEFQKLSKCTFCVLYKGIFKFELSFKWRLTSNSVAEETQSSHPLWLAMCVIECLFCLLVAYEIACCSDAEGTEFCSCLFPTAESGGYLWLTVWVLFLHTEYMANNACLLFITKLYLVMLPVTVKLHAFSAISVNFHSILFYILFYLWSSLLLVAKLRIVVM